MDGPLEISPELFIDHLELVVSVLQFLIRYSQFIILYLPFFQKVFRCFSFLLNWAGSLFYEFGLQVLNQLLRIALSIADCLHRKFVRQISHLVHNAQKLQLRAAAKRLVNGDQLIIGLSERSLQRRYCGLVGKRTGLQLEDFIEQLEGLGLVVDGLELVAGNGERIDGAGVGGAGAGGAGVGGRGLLLRRGQVGHLLVLGERI